MAKGHRSQIKRERNAQKDTRPSAKLSYARVSVQKASFVLDAIRGKDVQTALGIVTYNPRYASELIAKLLKSAIANAENNNGMNPENLYVEECYANKGPTMKRRCNPMRLSVSSTTNSTALLKCFIWTYFARSYKSPTILPYREALTCGNTGLTHACQRWAPYAKAGAR